MVGATCGSKSLYLNLPVNCDLTSRLDLDARPHESAPARRAGTPGRPRQVLQTRGRCLTLNTYGHKDHVRLADRVACLYAMPERSVRVVAVEPLTGGRTVQAFYSTCHQASAADTLTWYALR